MLQESGATTVSLILIPSAMYCFDWSFEIADQLENNVTGTSVNVRLPPDIASRLVTDTYTLIRELLVMVISGDMNGVPLSGVM